VVRMARKSKYESHVKPRFDEIKKWRADGLTEKQIYKKLGVAESTGCLYKDKHSEFSDLLKKAVEDIVFDLEKSLYNRAKGFYVTEETEIERIDDKGKLHVIERRRQRKWIHSDACMIFALKNRAPEKWREKVEVEQKNTGTVTIVDDLK
jgi:hypothetical protein